MSSINDFSQPGGSCFGITACNTLKIFIECLTQIYQGADAELEFLITDEDGLPVNIDDVAGIYIRVYGDKYTYLTYIYPDTTGTLPITILQHEEDDEQVDVGIFSIKIPADQSVNFMTGSLFAEIKIKMIDTNWPDGFKTKILSCLKIADIKLSQTRDISDF